MMEKQGRQDSNNRSRPHHGTEHFRDLTKMLQNQEK
jgi:hypothetical protein